MDRRGFISGTFGGLATGGIIIAASVPDTRAFVEQVGIGDPMASAVIPKGNRLLLPGDTLFDATGSPVAVVEFVTAVRSCIDVTSVHQSDVHVLPGILQSYAVHARGIFNPARQGDK